MGKKTPALWGGGNANVRRPPWEWGFEAVARPGALCMKHGSRKMLQETDIEANRHRNLFQIAWDLL